MLTYVELEKTNGQYKVALKKWGEQESLATDAIDTTRTTGSEAPTGITNNVQATPKNGKHISNRTLLIRHNGKTYDVEGRTR